MIRLFFWTKDEWSCPEWSKKYADKLWHLIGESSLTLAIPILILRWNYQLGALWCTLAAFVAGVLWEIIVDCWLTNNGASKYDLLADGIGCLLGMAWLLVSKWPFI